MTFPVTGIPWPITFLLDASGRIRCRIQGDPDWDDENTIAQVEKLLGETSPANQ